jgi:hypothetical protein
VSKRLYKKKNNITSSQTPYKSTKRTPRDTPKLHFYYITSGCKFAARLHERIGERARESKEKFVQLEVTMRIHVQMRRGELLLREGGREGGTPFSCITSVTFL